MSKQVIYNPEARLKLLAGIDKVARAVKVTMGNNGPPVMIQHRTDGILPVFTRDGVTVARAIDSDDRVAALGGRMLKDVAGAVSRQVGDGTTTAIVLAEKLAQECLKSVAAGFHPLQLKAGMDNALAMVEKRLADTAVKDMSADWVEKLAAVASKNEAGVGKLLSEAIQQLGAEGALNFELGNSFNDSLEITDGSEYPQGYLSRYFVTDKIREEAVLENPYILLYDREIKDLMDLIPILEEVKAQGRSLLIIAENVVDKALTGLLLNHVRGIFKVVAVKPPGFGDKRINRLKDLALLTGGQATLDDYSSPKLEDVTLAQLGQAKRVVVTEGSTTIIGANSDATAVAALIERLEHEAAVILAKKPGDGSPSGNKHDFEELEERIAFLAGKTGLFSVGGVTDFEMKERMVRIENAYNSAKAALEEGVLPGGGVALLRCSESLKDVIAENAGQQQGFYAVQQAMTAPFYQITHNAGVNAEVVLARLDNAANDQYAFDTATGQYGHFLDLGIMDAVKVMRLALKNAVSVVGTLITAETVIMHVPDLSIMAGFSPEEMAATREDPRA